jgi:peptide/nickel transport system ATP-binding protein
MVADRTVRCLRAGDIKEQEQAPAESVVHAAVAEGARTPVLSLRHVVARYGSAPVLSDISFDVMPESCLAVVGESGSGKTTLARCIVGLHENWSGEMTFAGSALVPGARKRPKELLKRVQYIFQNPYTSLNPRKTIGQIVSQPLEHFFDLPLTERSRRVQKVLEDVSLGADFFNRYPDQLSGGERQRVAIARALVVEPELLVCDEVTSALDVSVQAIIVELLRRLQKEHQLAMVFITHNLALVRSIAQDTVVLCEGRVVEAGSVDEILEHPKQEYTIRLMEDVPKLARVGTAAPAAS